MDGRTDRRTYNISAAIWRFALKVHRSVKIGMKVKPHTPSHLVSSQNWVLCVVWRHSPRDWFTYCYSVSTISHPGSALQL